MLVLAACAREAPSPVARRANPASANCVKAGGRLAIEKKPGGEYGVCYFDDNRQCEEWALLRGECPVGGRKVTGYATAAGRYCAIIGGQYSVTSGADATDENGNCTLGNGKVCEAEEFYVGACTR